MLKCSSCELNAAATQPFCNYATLCPESFKTFKQCLSEFLINPTKNFFSVKYESLGNLQRKYFTKVQLFCFLIFFKHSKCTFQLFERARLVYASLRSFLQKVTGKVSAHLRERALETGGEKGKIRSLSTRAIFENIGEL